jgi:hypothetical protein
VDELARNVALNESAPNELRTDAYLYLGRSAAERDKSSDELFETARALSPNARRCIVYSAMGLLSSYAALDRAQREQHGRAILVRAQTLVRENRLLFPSGDSWLASFSDLLDRLEHEGHESSTPPAR